MADAKPKKVSQKWKKYEITGDTLKRKNKTCPKCGPGVFLAEHKDRVACGNCGYMEKKSTAPAPQEAKPEPKPEAPKEEPKEEVKEEAPAEEASKEAASEEKKE